MKWKDSDEMTDKEEINKEEYFDEEQYSPWAGDNNSAKGGKLGKIPMVFILLGLAIITSVAALLMLLLSSKGQGGDLKQLTQVEERIRQLEERLDKFEAIDEKVTRIWEQAKSFEKFQDRFDRGEASMSLRMDHLTMSLETLQKQVGGAAKAPHSAASVDEKKIEDKKSTSAPAIKAQYHIVAAGDTFFSIAKRYDLAVADLLKINNLKKESVLKVGQKLLVRESQ